MKHKILRFTFALLALSLLVAAPRAQQATAPAKQSTEDRIALYQALLDLTNPWTVMCIAAHPDDEDGTSLIVMRHKFGAHTVSLFSTFGEGGQNAIGPELYEEMGAIRARETMAAAEIQGSEPHFLGLKDFGYSKTADEAFRFWGHEEGLRRMVLEIRKLRPDVIITNHSVTSNDHGQHQATARMVVEAFDAAADSNKFPEQLKDGVTTWQVQRLFVRVRGTPEQLRGGAQGNQAQTANAQIVTIDPNEHDPVRGVIYAEEALRALQKHATQGPWPKTFAEFAARFRAFAGQSAAPGQLPLIRYRLAREAKGADALPKDSRNFLDGLRLPEEVAKRLQPPTIEGKSLTDFADEPERLLSSLTPVHKNLMRSWSKADIETPANETSRRVSKLLSDLGRAIALSAGITSRLILRDQNLVPGQPAHLSFVISNAGKTEVRPHLPFEGMSQSGEVAMFCCADFPRDLRVPSGKTIDIPITALTPRSARPSVPYAQHLYDDHQSRMAIGVGPLAEVGGTLISIRAFTFADVAPAVEIERVAPSPLILTPKSVNTPLSFTLHLINHENKAFRGILSAQGESLALSLPAQAANAFQFRLPHGLPGKTSQLKFTVTGSAAESANVPVVFSNALVTLKLRVGYIRGFDYSLSNALAALGVESKELSVDEVKTVDLQKYSTIIVDNRVYESQPELIATNQKLLDFANVGGTLIVFYHKSDEWNPDARRNRPQLAPYKLILGNERITDENAPITFIEPQHPLLNVPNKMGQEDFTGWIQERGLYYPREWDPQFHALLQSNDPGEAPLKGGLLVADFGRGHYIYTSMVWYRQLRAGVPGAYRMFANMISYGH
jgi:LmbE family N-acetylglucosaminyl deacetylase